MFIVAIIISQLCAFFYHSTFNLNPTEITTVVAPWFAAAALLVSIFCLNWSYAFLGFAICFFPLFGQSCLSLSICFWCLGRAILLQRNFPTIREVLQNKIVLCYLLLSLLVLQGIFRALVINIDVEILRVQYEHLSFKDFIYFYISQTRKWAEPVGQFVTHLNSLLLLVIVSASSFEKERKKFFFVGVFGGLTLAAIITVLQILNIYPFPVYNTSAFWTLSKRLSGTFTDPNAFGLMGALILPYLYEHIKSNHLKNEKLILNLILALISICFLWSGSRTFFLGILIWVILSLICDRRKLINLFYFSILSILLLLSLNTEFARTKISTLNIPAISRVSSTLNLESAKEMFYSRNIYSRIAIQVWRQSPVLGVGTGNFYNLQEKAATELHIDLHGWKDNANNFYLQILSEQGLIGLCIVIGIFAGLIFFNYQSSQNLIDVRSSFGLRFVILFILLLFTGPHLFFEELKYLLAIVLGVSAQYFYQEVENNHNYYLKTLVVLLLVLIVSSLFVDRFKLHNFQGFHEEEYDGNENHRWTSQTASFKLCDESSNFKLRFSALNPDVENKHIKLKISSAVEDKEIEIADNTWKEIEVARNFKQDEIKLIVDRVWSPRDFGTKGDLRYLGVMIKSPETACK